MKNLQHELDLLQNRCIGLFKIFGSDSVELVMFTFNNQPNPDQYLTLPVTIAIEVIGRMRNNPKCVIHRIKTILDNGNIKQEIKYHYI